MSGLRAGWLRWRNGLLASPRFQAFSARCWLTRPVARRRARALFDLVAGFTYSQTLAAFVEMGLPSLLADEPRDLPGLAAAIDLPEAAAGRLLRAAAALGLAERNGDRWTLGEQGAALLGNPGIAAMVAHHRLLYADLADPVAALRRGPGGGALAQFWRYAGTPGAGLADDVAAYSALMAASQPLVARQILDAYPFARHRLLLDVGGGEGAFLGVVGERVPGLQRGLFDLPAVGLRASARLGPGVAIHGGSFFGDPLPGGYDLVSLIRILHDHDDAPARRLLRSIFDSLPTAGTLLIAEPMAGTSGGEPAGDAYFGLYLWAMGSGRPRPAHEIAAMLREAGFRSVREHRSALPMTVRIITGVKPD